MEAIASSVAEGEVPNTLVLAQPEAPYLSLGFHQSLSEEIDPSFLSRHPMPVLRRVEGGGTTYLDADQWFYQLVYREESGGAGGPKDLERFLRGPIRAARELGLPAAFRPPSDLVVGDRKFSGNAGGDWEGAHLIVGGFLGRANFRAMSDLLRLPHPAFRPLLHREIERWVTSWEIEAGAFPSPEALRESFVKAFAREGLFQVRRGSPTPTEEERFLTETLPRHGDPLWRELTPVVRRPDAALRRIRVAGPHGLLVLSPPSGRGLWAAVMEADRVREGYSLSSEEDPLLRPVPEGSPEAEELREAARSQAPFL